VTVNVFSGLIYFSIRILTTKNEKLKSEWLKISAIEQLSIHPTRIKALTGKLKVRMT